MRISSLYLVRHPDARAILSQKRWREFVSYQSFAKRNAKEEGCERWHMLPYATHKRVMRMDYRLIIG